MNFNLRRVALLTLALLLAGGCTNQQASNPSPSRPAAPNKEEPAQTAEAAPPHSTSMISAHLDLRPLGGSVDASAVLAELRKNLPEDAETAALLKRLHGGLAIRLEVLPARDRLKKKTLEEQRKEAAEDLELYSAPIPPGVAGVLRLALDEEFRGGKPDPRKVTIAVGGAGFVNFPNKPESRPTRVARPEVVDAVVLIVNDYLLRTNKGCVLVHQFSDRGQVYTEKLFEKLGNDPGKHRAHVQDGAEAVAKAYRDYWTSQGAELP